MEYFIFTVLFILVVFLASFMIFKPVIDDKKSRNNVKNSDLFMQDYCFTLTCNQLEAINQLSIRNDYDTLEYKFDADRLTIVFSHLGVSIEHQLSFYAVEDKIYLKVSRVKFMHGKSNVPFMINKFFVKKIGAIPVDYSYFESTVDSLNS